MVNAMGLIDEEGVKQLFINFWPNKNSSLKILLEDKALACNRTIKYHKFFFSGQSVEITDLGKSNRGFFDLGGGEEGRHIGPKSRSTTVP